MEDTAIQEVLFDGAVAAVLPQPAPVPIAS
jgi:hypothetical protein